MTTELVTGALGTPHIDGADWGALNAGILGQDDYVLNLWNQFSLTVQTSTKLTLDTGCAVLNGRQVVITAPESIDVTPAANGTYRTDLLCLRYKYDSASGRESASPVLVAGTPVATGQTAADPKINTQSIINQSTTVHDFALWRVQVDAVGATYTTRLFDGGVLSPLSYRQRVSPYPLYIDRSGTSSAGDTLVMDGAYIPTTGTSGIVTLAVNWTNKGTFTSKSWEMTNLGRLYIQRYRTSGDQINFIPEGFELHQMAAENSAWDKQGHSMFVVTGQNGTTNLQWQTTGEWEVAGNMWHHCSMTFGVRNVNI
ncbi:hypothetical protein [Bifidobacterium vansinderenii]|uniref:Uncharacterized protein n=2 Tax=Bifidobacterium vansinderenii TaxID=1984871 RepID=A0A229VY15_9BIFI|nr:hypothetical protein [Bifidobacterium vansinderenii]OXN00518.1 hypothetical protein Tam10B_1388 [Bifidobacterium vansinderenii]